MPNKFVQTYLREIEQIHARGNATEHSYRGALTTLIDALNPKVRAVNEPKRIKVGAPDYIISPAGQSETPLGYIEAKDIGVDLDGKDTQKQLARYVDGLGNVILTDYIEFRWYAIDSKSHRYAVTLAKVNGKKLVAEDADEKFVDLLGQFLSSTVSTVKSAKELAKRMANLAKIIRDIILNAINEGESAQLIETRNSFREVLLHDMTDAQFADMYAQTISYGMFAARVNHNIKKSKFERMTAGYDLPKTNPFLRQLFNTIGGTELDERVTWTVDELANLLNYTDMEDILRDFGTRTRQEDPVVHFYETFLAAYDPKLRESRGVYYTPEPVVSYIVRSVDHILKTDFGLEKGLADSSKIQTPSPNPSRKREGDKNNSPLPQSGNNDLLPSRLREGPGEGVDLHKVLILDPACGTGTFLHGVIDQIHDNFKGNEGAWSSYVSEHLLPRIFGFELLMAPYAVAHLKLGLQLKEYGYDFKSDERLRVYLTNTLEEAFTADERLPFSNYLAKEANAANEVKRDLPIMVVLGNPPYERDSINASPYTDGLLKRYKDHVKSEGNIQPLNNDYIKFLAFAEDRIMRTGSGVVAFITSSSYLSGSTIHKGVRRSLLESFDKIYIVNLYGGAVGTSMESSDENIFDIQESVAIFIGIRHEKRAENCELHYEELLGSRMSKYGWLSEKAVQFTDWRTLHPTAPQYFFVPKSFESQSEYDDCVPVTKVFGALGKNNPGKAWANGVKTNNNDLFVNLSLPELKKKINLLSDRSKTASDVKHQLGIVDGKYWDTERERAKIGKQEISENFHPYHFRPFDVRWIFYQPNLIEIGRGGASKHVMRQLFSPNMALIVNRTTSIGEAVDHFFITRYITDVRFLPDKEGIPYLLPLYIYPDPKKDLFSEASTPDPTRREPNLSPKFIAEFSERLHLTFIPDGNGNLKKTFGPEDVFHYMYAVFHSPMYRARYAEFLKIDFPRLPLTSNLALFRTLCKLGEQLVALHLMEKFGKPLTGFRGKGSDMVEYVKYDQSPNVIPANAGIQAVASRRAMDSRFRGNDINGSGIVKINEDQYFDGIPDAVWNFRIGGYQVAQKWLKDRKGRTLSYDDIEHYHHIISALSETMRLMKEIDEVIVEAGGFPLK